MCEAINPSRRRFVNVAAMALAGARLGALGAERAQSAGGPFGDLKQIDVDVLNVGYANVGSASGPAVVLLHGWPYDIHSFVEVAPLLAARGYRVLIPNVRGYGTTRFLSNQTVRNGQQAALASDCLAFMDALGIERAVIAGFDWGARTANIVAALWPKRCKALVSVSGYLIGSREANRMPLPPQAELEWWYQYYFATDRGRAGYEKYRREFVRLIWQIASPKWRFADATFDLTVKSFDNPDHVNVVIHNHRWRLGLAEGESKYDDLETQLATAPVITVTTITLEGDANVAPHPALPRTPRTSPGSTNTGLSRAASDTTCRRRRRKRSPMP
jgi:pimeloyl-ACP methyl ester carboxylesterase